MLWPWEGEARPSPKGRFHCTGGPRWKIYLGTGLPPSLTSPLGSQVTISYMTLDKSLPIPRRPVSSNYKIKDPPGRSLGQVLLTF